MQFIAHLRPRIILNAQNKHTKYWISFRFKAPVTGFDFCKRCHHYKLYLSVIATQDDKTANQYNFHKTQILSGITWECAWQYYSASKVLHCSEVHHSYFMALFKLLYYEPFTILQY